MKRTGRCSKCEGTQIVHLQYVLDATEWSTMSMQPSPLQERRGESPVPRYLGRMEVSSRGLFGLTTTEQQLVAPTEAYICADCGWFEEHVISPADIPWDKVQGASWHRPGAV